MRLSKLQKFILLTCWSWKQKKVLRREFLRFYENYKRRPSKEDMINVVTKSLLRLIKRNLIVGFGEITSQKTYIQYVRLTKGGRKEMRRLLDRQQRLPLKVKSLKSKVKS